MLAGDKFMSEMHLRQPEFTCIGCDLITETKERIHKFKETGGSRNRRFIVPIYLYQNGDFEWWSGNDFKHLPRRIASKYDG